MYAPGSFIYTLVKNYSYYVSYRRASGGRGTNTPTCQTERKSMLETYSFLNLGKQACLLCISMCVSNSWLYCPVNIAVEYFGEENGF